MNSRPRRPGSRARAPRGGSRSSAHAATAPAAIRGGERQHRQAVGQRVSEEAVVLPPAAAGYHDVGHERGDREPVEAEGQSKR